MAASDKKTYVKLNTGYAGNTLNKDGEVAGYFAHAKGDKIYMPSEEAVKFIQRGFASLAKEGDE